MLQPGYRIGDRICGPARVAVAEPGGDDGDGTGRARQARSHGNSGETRTDAHEER